MRSNLMIIAIALVATLLAGPSFAADAADAADQMLTSEEQALLKSSKEFKAMSSYDYPDFNLNDYPKVLIGAITIYYSDDSKSKAIDPDDSESEHNN